MLDFRVKKPTQALNWRYQEIIVTEEYLSEHDDPNLITLEYPYEMGKKVLDVYLNGNRLTEGGGYEEVDDTHIRLDIRTYDDEGNQVPATLQVGDEIVIKEWFNSDSLLYSPTGLNSRLTAVEIEVRKARNYSDDEIVFPDLRSRLNFMQDEIDQLKGSAPIPDDLLERIENIETELSDARSVFPTLDDRLDYIEDLASRGGSGEAVRQPLTYNAEIRYILDPNTGNVTQEIATGDFPYTKTFVYDPITNKLLTEVTVFEGASYVCTYEYDSDGNKIREYGNKVDWLATLTLHNYLRPTRYYVHKEYLLDSAGNVVEEVSKGEVEYVKTYEYTDGLVTKETLNVFGETYEKLYLYENGNLFRETGYSMELVSAFGRAVCSLYRKDVLYGVDQDGNITGQEITGSFVYDIDYEYENGLISVETARIGDTEYTKTYAYSDNEIVVSGVFVVEYGDKLDVAYTLASTLQKGLDYLLGEGDYEIIFEYDNEGNVVKEIVSGDYRIEKEYEYNDLGKITKETVTRDGRVTVKTYTYNSQGRIERVLSETLR